GHTLTAICGGNTQVRFDRLGVASASLSCISGALEIFQLANPDCRSGQPDRERTITLLTSGSVNVARANCP
ncbi:MAG: hypothetical protein KJO66_02040, partial [Gammaproteobacteria bacterium]|nr:hypothetical protein [Gammaproteobacteria bacterium]